MLAERMYKNNVDCWLINTGWTGGKFGSGKRCPLKYTRRIVDAVHSGLLAQAEYETFGVFGLQIPDSGDAIEGAGGDEAAEGIVAGDVAARVWQYLGDVRGICGPLVRI